MKLGIIGLPQSGKSIVFEALTRNTIETGNKSKDRIAAVKVSDGRVDFLSDMYKPKKTRALKGRSSVYKFVSSRME